MAIKRLTMQKHMGIWFSNNNNVTSQDKSRFPGKCIADSDFKSAS